MKRIFAWIVAGMVVLALLMLPEWRLEQLYPKVQWWTWSVAEQYIVLFLHDPIVHWAIVGLVAFYFVRGFFRALRREVTYHHRHESRLAYEVGWTDGMRDRRR